MLTTPNFVAGGDIYPCRFVTLVNSGVAGIGMTVLQAGVGAGSEGDFVIGVSQEGTKKFDSALAAASGDQLEVSGPGHYALVTCGAVNIAAGVQVKAGLDGKALIVAADKDCVGGLALTAGLVGEKFWVLVNPYKISM